MLGKAEPHGGAACPIRYSSLRPLEAPAGQFGFETRCRKIARGSAFGKIEKEEEGRAAEAKGTVVEEIMARARQASMSSMPPSPER